MLEPKCPVFGTCGGCDYQDIPYDEELSLKEKNLRKLLSGKLSLSQGVFEPITRSPEDYHYRNRLDLGIRRTRAGEYLFGFQEPLKRRFVEVRECSIARKEISDFIPKLRKEAIEKLPENYRNANLTIKVGDEGRVFWGGIGRRSLALPEEDYLWTVIGGKKIFYSLDTFFQANIAILPALMDKIQQWVQFDKETVFLDLYAGVGLFGFTFQDEVKRSVLIECGFDSVKLMKFNAKHHQNERLEMLLGTVEEKLPEALKTYEKERKVAMIDPPRKGLSEKAARLMTTFKQLDSLLYLSCNPEALVRDLEIFKKEGWTVEKIAPFDFFPRTKHLETLVLLKP